MSMIPEVKCRRCGESFSALRSRCPNCGTRRVTQSSRTPGTTPGNVRGTASYERAETNTKWQMIFGLILVVAVILAVIIMVSTSLNGLDNNKTTTNVRATPSPTPTEQISSINIEAPPTPSPTPTPSVQDVKVFFFQTEIATDFTMHLNDEPITLTAKAYPMDQFADARFTWKSEDSNYLKLTPSDDGTECSFEILATKAGGVAFTVTCNGFEIERRVYLVN